MKTSVVLFVMLALFVGGCGGAKEMMKGSVSKDPVKTSGKKPDWVSDDITYKVEDGQMKFRTMSDNEADLSFAMKGLDGQAYNSLINIVKVRAGLEFDEAVKGSKYNSASIGQTRQSVVNAMGDVKFSGLVKEREYWEQYEKSEGMSGVSYIHTAYGLYSIPESEVARAKEAAWTKAKETADSQADRDAKQLLEEAKARFLGREK